MAGQLKPFQMRDWPVWSGLTKKNHLSAIFKLQPQRASDVMIRLLALYRGKTLDTFLSKYPTREFNDDSEIIWDVVGSTKRPIELLEARRLDGSVIEKGDDNVGIGGERFYMVFPIDYFKDGEVIFGKMGSKYSIRLIGPGRPEGSNTVHLVHLLNSTSEGMRAELLQPKEKFMYQYAPVSRTLSRKVGDLRYSAPITMRNEWSTIRLHTEMTGDMINQHLMIGIPYVDENGKVTRTDDMWVHHVEWTFEQQWQDYKNNLMAHSVSTRNENGEYPIDEKSGEPIIMGDGLYAQIENGGNVEYYNDESTVLKVINDAIRNLIGGRMELKNTTIVLRTGLVGFEIFSKAVIKEMGGDWLKPFTTMDAVAAGAVKKTTSSFHPNAFGAGFAFTEYTTPYGFTIKLDYDIQKDDPNENFLRLPDGRLASSAIFDIMDIGTTNQPNVQKCKIKGQPENGWSYVEGIRNPFTGDWQVDKASRDVDATEIHRLCTYGIMVYDATRFIRIKPAIYNMI